MGIRSVTSRTLCGLIFAFCFLIFSVPIDAQDAGGVDAKKGIEYARVGGMPMRLDLYLPKNLPAEKLPVVVWIHGGAWRGGDRNFCPIKDMAPLGFVVASIDYRLAPAFVYPAQIEDCKAAIRWLRANSEKYSIDPNRIGVIGASAGGHLAAMLGTAPDQQELEGEGNRDQSSRVQAVVDLCGPTDLARIADIPWRIDLLKDLLGGPLEDKQDMLRLANPITFITKDDPPFLIMHGEKDSIVPVNQSELLRDALQAVGVEVKLHVVPDAEHGFFFPGMLQMIHTFFQTHLKTPAAPGEG